MTAFETLRDDILAEQYAPGERLVETVIARRLNVSRPTLRAVLERLEQERYVTRALNCGAFVRTFSLAEAFQIFEARQMVEGFLASLAAERAEEPDIARLERIAQEAEEAAAEDEVDRYTTLSIDFHDAISSAANQEVVAGFLRSLRYPIALCAGKRSADASSRLKTLAEHRAIVACIRIRDGVGAEEVMRRHLAGIQSRANLLLRSMGNRSSSEKSTRSPSLATYNHANKEGQ
jgi:DNA-binding GntR family transcriptional regulator